MTDSSKPDPVRSLTPSGEARAAVCPSHGPFESRHLLRSIWSGCPACAADAVAAKEAEQQEQDRRRREREHQAQLGAAAIPARFVGRGFDNYRADTDAQRRALTVCRDYAEQFGDHHRRGTGLILAGTPGTGKSHLAGAILQRLLPRPVRYSTAMDIIRGVRSTWRRDSEKSERDLLRYLTDLDLLVIDEIGAQYGTDGEATILFDILDRRYREMRPTILLTNQDREGLKEYVGERSFDRLVETCRWIPFDWPSYRPQARREAQQ